MNEEKIHELGEELAKLLPENFHGNVQFNFKEGRYIAANVNETIVPDKKRSFKTL